MSADDVIGYLTTCEACGGRALTLHQHGADWRCPSCPDMAAPQPFSAEPKPLPPYWITVERPLDLMSGALDAANGVEVAVKLPAEFDTPNGLAALLRLYGVRVEFVEPAADDEYPVGQVRG